MLGLFESEIRPLINLVHNNITAVLDKDIDDTLAAASRATALSIQKSIKYIINIF